MHLPPAQVENPLFGCSAEAFGRQRDRDGIDPCHDPPPVRYNTLSLDRLSLW